MSESTPTPTPGIKIDVQGIINKALNPNATATPKPQRPLQSYSETELRQLSRTNPPRITRDEWVSELQARGMSPQAANDAVTLAEGQGYSTAAGKSGQLLPSEQSAITALQRSAPTATPVPPPAAVAPTADATASAQPFTGGLGEFPQRDIATGATASAEPFSGTVPPLAPPDVSTMGATQPGGALGPGGRTFEQATGKDYINQAERDWYLAEAARRRGGATGGTTASAAPRATGGTATGAGGGTTAGGGAGASTGGTTRTGAKSLTSKPGEQELIDAGGLQAMPGVYYVPTVGGGWALYREGTKGDYSFSRALNKSELAVAQRESARIAKETGQPAPEGIAPAPGPQGDRFYNPGEEGLTGAPGGPNSQYIPSFVGNESAEQYGRTGRGETDPVFGTGRKTSAGDEVMTSRPVINGVQIDPAMLSNPGYMAATLGTYGPTEHDAAQAYWRDLGLMAPAPRTPMAPLPVPDVDKSKPTKGEVFAQTFGPNFQGWPDEEMPGFQEGGSITASAEAFPYDPDNWDNRPWPGPADVPLPYNNPPPSWYQRTIPDPAYATARAEPYYDWGISPAGTPTHPSGGASGFGEFNPATNLFDPMLPPPWLVPPGSPEINFANGGSVMANADEYDQGRQQPMANELPIGVTENDWQGNPVYPLDKTRGGLPGFSPTGYTSNGGAPFQYGVNYGQGYGSPEYAGGPQPSRSDYAYKRSVDIQADSKYQEAVARWFALNRGRAPTSQELGRLTGLSAGGSVMAGFAGGGAMMGGLPPIAPAPAGSQMMTQDPIMGVNTRTQQPEFMVGEAGPEMLNITPMGGGQAPMAPAPMAPMAPPQPVTPFAQLLESLMSTTRGKNRPGPTKPVGGSVLGGSY